MAPDDGCLTDSSCRGHYDQAVKLFEGGRFEAALPEFQGAYERRQMPWLLINIGRTLHRLGRPREALEYYDRYRAAETKPDAETQERLEKYTAQAKALADTTPTTATPPAVTPAPDSGSSSSAPPAESKPLYKKWWFWTAIGGGVAAVVIIGVAVGVASRNSSAGLPSGVPAVTFTF
jgi:tetratricopeptide (TPR) repeat protein